MALNNYLGGQLVYCGFGPRSAGLHLALQTPSLTMKFSLGEYFILVIGPHVFAISPTGGSKCTGFEWF